MIKPTHTPACDVRVGVNSKAFWSLGPNRKLMVFVHGFSGAAIPTWRGLPEQLMIHPETKGCDLVFFGYDSVTQTASESANQLHVFINGLVDGVAKVVNPSIGQYNDSLRRDSAWRYNEVILIGHSLGACVIRRAILDQHRGGTIAWPEKTKVMFFAPAHGGAKIWRLLMACGVGIPGKVGLNIAGFLAPALQDLKPGSDFLKTLRRETEQFCDAHAPLKVVRTFWAYKDKVVLNSTFGKDATPYTEIRKVNHVSICKLNGFDDRVDLLLKELSK